MDGIMGKRILGKRDKGKEGRTSKGPIRGLGFSNKLWRAVEPCRLGGRNKRPG